MSQVLDLFSKVSYYKVNSSKSLILGFSVDPSTKSNIQSAYPYAWNDTSIPYLGIHLPNRTSLLLEANFPPLLNSIQTDIHRLARIDNSWLGRIVIYKMIDCTPKNPISTLPILIPNRIFQQFQKQINNFVWRNRKPRLSLPLMNKKAQMGGLGLSKLKAYHIAVTLDQIKHWWHNSPNT